MLDQRFWADLDDPGLDFFVTIGIVARAGRLVAEEVTVKQRGDGPPVTSAALRRLPLESYLARVRSHVLRVDLWLISRRSEQSPGPGRVGLVRASPASREDRNRFDSAQRQRHEKAETLPLVARAYEDAKADPDPLVSSAPIAAVARKLSYSRGHASRLLTEARKAGLLEPARAKGIATSAQRGKKRRPAR